MRFQNKEKGNILLKQKQLTNVLKKTKANYKVNLPNFGSIFQDNKKANK